MSIDIDTKAFLATSTLPKSTINNIEEFHQKLKDTKNVFSINDTLGKSIASGYYGDMASAHFRRWILENYEIGDCDE